MANSKTLLKVTNAQRFATPLVGTTPTIQEVDMTHFLDLPATGTGSVSGVIGDDTDPAATQGINFKIADADTAIDQLTVTVTSSNQSVVSNDSLVLTGVGVDRNLKINPAGVGVTDLQVEVSDGTNTSLYTIQYGASAGADKSASSHFHTGTSDASTAIAIDANYMFVADDESQVIRLYDRNHSGLPINEFDFTSALGLTDEKNGVFREVDIEASTQVGNRIYWLGSHSNSSKGKDRPNRSRLFATEIVGNGADAKLAFVGYVDFREDLIRWGDTQGYNFSASAATGQPTEFPDSFNIEGLTTSPDGNTAYIAFRAPNLPTTARTRALIAPLNNFADLIEGKATTAVFGDPIELALGGRGIRSIERNVNNEYLIVAGPAGSATGTAPNDFRLYTWNGVQADKPVLMPTQLPDLSTSGSFETIVSLPDRLSATSEIQLLIDNGDTDWYGTGQDSKDLPKSNLQKFASVTVTLGQDPDVTVPIDPNPGPNPTRKTIFGDRNNNRIIGTHNNDRIRAFAGNDILKGGKGRDWIQAGLGNDILEGQGGKDTLEGAKGDDILIGGYGRDILTGGSGQDTFVYRSFGDHHDTITDFDAMNDKIDLRHLLKGPKFGSANAFDDYVKLEQSGADTTVNVDAFGDTGNNFRTMATLTGVDASSLTVSHFLVG